ncbi:unnamed protein product [Dicrocoelium dendriticum]|nr:unnamed protein product [Dicrocoelium dendriticum]
MTWNDELKLEGNAESLQIQTDCCKLLTTTLASATCVSQNAMKCDMTKLSGNPAGGYMTVVFKIGEVQNKTRGINEVITKLRQNVAKGAKENEVKPGPVVGAVRKHVVTTDQVGNTVVRFKIDILENGQFSEWRSAYDNVAELKKIESSICPRLLLWGRLYNLTKDAPFFARLPVRLEDMQSGIFTYISFEKEKSPLILQAY